MKNGNPTGRQFERTSMGFLIGGVLIALGIIANLVIRGSGGSPITASLVVYIASLVGAIVIDRMGDRSGTVLGAMLLWVVLSLLPLLWVSDDAEFLRENPGVGSVLVILAAAYSQRYNLRWPPYVVALFFGLLQILVSFF